MMAALCEVQALTSRNRFTGFGQCGLDTSCRSKAHNFLHKNLPHLLLQQRTFHYVTDSKKIVLLHKFPFVPDIGRKFHFVPT